MIVDRMENAGAYQRLGKSLAEALDYLGSTDFSKVEAGRHGIDGDRLFAIVQRYEPKPLSEIIWESHRRYIDVQYVVEGTERMGYVNLGDGGMTVTEDNSESDYIFYDAQGELFEVQGGTFVIYTPQDVHAPSLAPASTSAGAQVLKAVVKVQVNESSGPCGF